MTLVETIAVIVFIVIIFGVTALVCGYGLAWAMKEPEQDPDSILYTERRMSE